ncbi:GCN5-related N-acetyltransferase [Methanosarcina barkeri 3]|uniref:GCN5-related N-acetyltransferase n=1 Tax=Methanosarcina barkeri 3 TaxID=1434107 RepID=A0A0E3SMI8_METBA|nr:GNAT family N-acetyltransferase [Methanosarcina barkeri]AKB82153.1 GCN5-related N-acetyltransferase [Methanosarcina barkeri 3]
MRIHNLNQALGHADRLIPLKGGRDHTHGGGEVITPQVIEELSMNAWPALQTMLYDGWVLRYSKGYTKRANSINPIYPSTLSINKKIEKCEAQFRSLSIDVVYKLTAYTRPENLDRLLEEKGYERKDETIVKVIELLDFQEPVMKDVEIRNILTKQWLDAFCQLLKVSEKNRLILQDMINIIIPEKYLLLLRQNGKVIGCGMGVIEDGFAGIYEITIDPELRRKGYGRQLMLNMLKYAYERGARKAYLQVVAANIPAVRLYENLGFKEAYRYWYRIK